MQLFSADATIFLKRLKKITHEDMKLLIVGPIFLFRFCQPAQKQPKSNFLFHKNASLCRFFIMSTKFNDKKLTFATSI